MTCWLLACGLRVCGCGLVVCICYYGWGCYCTYGLCLRLVVGFDLVRFGSGGICCEICLVALWEWCFG